MTVRLLGVGAASPALRLAAADVGAAWGRARPGPGRSVRPRRGHAHARVGRRDRALAAAGIEPERVDALLLGHEPAAVRRRPEPRVPRRGARLLVLGRRRAVRGLRARRHGGARGRGRRDRSRIRAHRDRRGERRGPARSRHRLRGPVRRGQRPRSCSAPTAAPAALGTRVSRTRPFLDRYRGDGEHDNRDLYDARLFREEMFLPVVTEVVEALASFDVARVVTPRSRRPARRDRRQAGRRARRRPPRRSTRPSVTPAPQPRSSAARSTWTHRASSRSSAPAAVAPPARWCTSTSRFPDAALVADALAEGRPVSYAEALRGTRAARPDRGDDPDGRAARERDVHPRRRRDARSPRWPLRRLRHDQHAAVDPSPLHQLWRAEARAGAALRAAARSTPSS